MAGFELPDRGWFSLPADTWRKAVQLNPKTTNTHYWLSKALMDGQRNSEALPVLRVARELYKPDERAPTEFRERADQIVKWLEQASATNSGVPHKSLQTTR